MSHLRKFLAVALLLLAGAASMRAQDVIYTRDGNKMTVNVIDIIGSSLIYNIPGQVANSYTIDLDDVAYVNFSENNPLLAAIYSWATISQPSLDFEIERLTRKKDTGNLCMLSGGLLAATGLSLSAISLILKKADPADSFVRTLGNVGLGCAAGGAAVFGIGLTIRNKAIRGLDEIYLGTTGNGFGLSMSF